MMRYLAPMFLLLCCCICNTLNAQQYDSVHTPAQIDTLTASTPIVTNSPEQVIPKTGFGFMSNLEFNLSISVLFFGLLVILLEVLLIRQRFIDSNNAVKFIIVTLIVTGTLFLITAGYNNNQIAPALGLFGTVAGYLLGKANTPNNEKDSQ